MKLNKIAIIGLIFLCSCEQKDFSQEENRAEQLYKEINLNKADIILLKCKKDLAEIQKDWTAYSSIGKQIINLQYNNKKKDNELSLIIAKLEDEKYPKINEFKQKYKIKEL